MAITNGYATLEQLQQRLDPTGTVVYKLAQEETQEQVIEAASRMIDEITETKFYASTQTRYFTARFSDLLYVDDLLSITTLKTDDDDDGTYENTWTTSDYDLEPINASADGEPYRQIRINTSGSYNFPRNVRHGVEIAGSWGYASTAPDTIHEACLLLAHRYLKRHDTLFGVAGAPSIGGVRIIQAEMRRDSDIADLLSGINRRWGS